ncbi:lipase/acyltransferase domain-containing protein [Burkholderia sp. SIMBA_062]|uniref:PGAP1-like alpha/beta domain-containing protein n=1 Tax=Burkholderia sp. SIMBA_062 TaxID=3085803 RepID=UPI003978FCFC
MPVERILAAKLADDGSAHYSSASSPSDDSHAVCHMVPDRVIPVIFVPGVMGSNLMNNQNQSVWVVNSGAGMLPWSWKDAAYRKQALDPANTKVFDGGDLPKGTSLTDAEKKARGWGTVSKKSYGDWLVWLQDALDDAHAGTNHGRNGLRNSLIKQVVAPGLDTLSDDEVELSYQYKLPVHAVGYNWLRSNKDSGEYLALEIDRIMSDYRKHFRCEKVIVVTHSMGGLVARYCSEVKGYRTNILGIVHSVMPAIGSATAYKRVKAGWEPGNTIEEGIGRKVLGETAAEITAVFAQSPGPLQLLPDANYGNGWLKIRDGDRFDSLPRAGDPYDEIYKMRGTWWGLVDDKLINPLDKAKVHLERDWIAYVDLIDKQVRTFQTVISDCYHEYTYAFYGNDEKHKTWGDVVWRRSLPKRNLLSSSTPPIMKPLELEGKWDSRTGVQRVIDRTKQPVPAIHDFVLQPAEENGDGTVPVRSGRAPTPHAKACVAFEGVDHEGAYNPLPCRLFALRAITRLVWNVKGTSMEYRAC